ncbi:hypothetical protein GCM10010430_70860 [Kitasatospora cystarginea]|uniref:Uncharacterized protein n=1 Tax=Kitasatospora cystarginea TaxID=58350 RepID=A0ABP5RWY6_9ACTN
MRAVWARGSCMVKSTPHSSAARVSGAVRKSSPAGAAVPLAAVAMLSSAGARSSGVQVGVIVSMAS